VAVLARKVLVDEEQPHYTRSRMIFNLTLPFRLSTLRAYGPAR
jgi:hypothetical protein